MSAPRHEQPVADLEAAQKREGGEQDPLLDEFKDAEKVTDETLPSLPAPKSIFRRRWFIVALGVLVFLAAIVIAPVPGNSVHDAAVDLVNGHAGWAQDVESLRCPEIPDAKIGGTAEAACKGAWAGMGESWAEQAAPVDDPLAVLSNGTHPWRRTVIIVSLDGFRSDYITRELTPNVLDVAEAGLRAEYMRPQFPSLTFPNHWSIQTGLHPESHGIVANDFTDPTTGDEFVYTDPARSWAPHWWGGSPMWETASKAGHKTGVIHWPGPPQTSTGGRPDFFYPFRTWRWSHKIELIGQWLDLPLAERPSFISAYAPEIDQAGHRGGPDSDGVNDQLRSADKFVAAIREAINARNLADVVDLIIVSDHGMTSTHDERVVYLDDVLGKDGFEAIKTKEGWPSCGLRFKEGTDEAEMLRRLRKAANQSDGGFTVHTVDDMPSQWHFSPANNPRIAPIYAVPKHGWAISDRVEHLDLMNGSYVPKGNHGYDPSYDDMHAIAVMHGPVASKIKRRLRKRADQITVIPPFENIEIYNLVMRLLDVPEDLRAPNNGTVGFWDRYLS